MSYCNMALGASNDIEILYGRRITSKTIVDEMDLAKFWAAKALRSSRKHIVGRAGSENVSIEILILYTGEIPDVHNEIPEDCQGDSRASFTVSSLFVTCNAITCLQCISHQ